ncbi:Tas retrotransposon peptidase A16 [Necator americanus]|uniref:Tas retrotransposon peptidase A16 n=1 Tax=Necator americanus TaxID=51031 RepID=W2THU8_NECAM|nr:Tas retrotransposon peptidase A16 [Necator americanus]ETN81650.1 Tas retrotransposon peptidase A16 [Necator americanus]
MTERPLKTSNSHNLSPSQLLRVLTDIVRKDTTFFEMEYHSRQNSAPENQYHGFHVISRTRTQRTMRTPPSKVRSKTCPLCKRNNHAPIECDVFPTAQQRNKQAREQHLCYNCLSERHSTKECPSKRSCKFCMKRHHSSLCFTQRQLRQQNARAAPTQNKERHATATQPFRMRRNFVNVAETNTEDFIPETRPDENNTTAMTCTSVSPTAHGLSSSQSILMCTMVKVFNPLDMSKETTALAFLDSGSSHSYITDELAKVLHLPGHTQEDISVSTFGTTIPLHLQSNSHVIGICTENGQRQLEVKSLPTLTGNLRHVHLPEDTNNGEFTVSSCKSSVLIGNDYFWDMILSENFHYEKLLNGSRLLHTNLGNVITGKFFSLRDANTCTYLSDDNDIANPIHHDVLSQLVSNFWKLESVGIMDDPSQQDNDVCLQFFNDNISFDSEGKRYIVKLPFKSDPSELSDNFPLAFSRLSSLVRSLKRNPSYMKTYHNVIMEQLQKGIIEEVPMDEMQKSSHYLSHHGVIKKEHNNVKMRCVFDGSAKMKGSPSINEVLYRGPVLLPDLEGILIRSRFHEILVISDIEKAFLMVGLHPDCRDFTRFLWLHDISKPVTSTNLKTYRFMSSSGSSAHRFC